MIEIWAVRMITLREAIMRVVVIDVRAIEEDDVAREQGEIL